MIYLLPIKEPNYINNFNEVPPNVFKETNIVWDNKLVENYYNVNTIKSNETAK